MSEHKIEDCTHSLYNIWFAGAKRKNECLSIRCSKGSCICIDREQTGLLRKVLSKEDRMAMSFVGERAFFQNLQNPLWEEDICGDAVTDKTIYCNALFCNKFSPVDEGNVCQIIKEYNVKGLLDVIKMIPAIYTTNSLHRFEERESLIYLCKYAPDAEGYITVLLRMVICATIDCCQKAKTKEQKEAYEGSLVKLFNRLETVLYQDYGKMDKYCIENVEAYSEIWKKTKLKCCKPYALAILSELQTYRQELEESVERPEMTEETNRHQKLYSLLKKILTTADVSAKNLPELFLVDCGDSENTKTEYDEIMEILDEVKSDAGKLGETWEILSRIFEVGEDIPAYELAKMRLLVAS